MNKRVVLITGGNRGIGRAIVDKFNSSKHTIYFTYRNGDFTDLPNNVRAIRCDINNREDVFNLVEQIVKDNNKIDVLVNNAGIMRDKTFLKMDFNTWSEVIETNLVSLFNLTQQVVKLMIEKKYGRIINISSMAALEGAFGKINYSSSKAGVIGFTKTLALEVAKKNITVNAVAPGLVKTDMIKAIPQKYLDDLLKQIPMQRFGEPIDVANLIYFLASDEASYITGQVISINGGLYL